MPEVRADLQREGAAPPLEEPPNIFSLANHPPWVIADWRFQKYPRELHIGRTRADNRRLFAKLQAEADAERRGEIFHEYVTVQFSLHEWDRQKSTNARRSIRNSYVRFLRGWSLDSNSIEGAVLKAWVASRFGLEPTFHYEVLEESPEMRERFEIERVCGESKTNAIFQQLDLLFEFCQEELTRRFGRRKHIRLYRGTFDAEKYPRVLRPEATLPVVRLNNLNSFTSDRETAWEFGSTVWEVDVPLAKIFFFSGLLPTSLLRGEGEFLVLGGEYEIRTILF
ncbi:MAG: NAD(+)--dinitrogen-reductase ADP-D-ribosyltransferase [Chthoniobacterales bacterium]|nr:NAD(+)--dinitrogen-reductase ADP-D-ribosyltransferase [Chthoniobacterales bacterium]